MDAVDPSRISCSGQSMHKREGGACFYGLRHVIGGAHCLDHVVPQVLLGGNSYRDFVSCCLECNSQKPQPQPPISSANSAAKAASPPSNSPPASTPWPSAASAPPWPLPPIPRRGNPAGIACRGGLYLLPLPPTEQTPARKLALKTPVRLRIRG